MGIHIVSFCNYPRDRGGAPLYNYLLQQIFPSAKRHCYADFPKGGNEPEHIKAYKLNRHLETMGLIKEGDFVVGDGIWGNYGLDEKRYQLISVCHGVWASTIPATDVRVSVQREGYHRSKITVAVSPYACFCCQKYYEAQSYVVMTGIDTDFWKPVKVAKSERPKVLWVSKWNEFPRLRTVAQAMLHNYDHIVLNTFDDDKVRELYSLVDVFAHVTSYEGNSFAILKALSCDLPVVCNDVGLFWSMPDSLPDSIGIKVDSQPASVVDAINKIYHNKDYYKPRKWVVCNADMGVFGRAWQRVITKIC